MGYYHLFVRALDARGRWSSEHVFAFTVELIDDDKDGLHDDFELSLYGTDNKKFDTNGDELGDGINISTGIPALGADSDGDGISNLMEIMTGTSPILADTDFDGMPDNLDPYPLDRSRRKTPAVNSFDHTPPVITVSF